MKKALIIGVLAIGGLVYAGKRTVSSIAQRLKQLQVQVAAIKIDGITATAINFTSTVLITNPTSEDLSIRTNGVLKVRRLIYRDLNGNVLGESYPNITALEVRAGETISIDNVPTALPFNNLGIALNTALASLGNARSIQVQAEIETPAGIFMT